MQKAVAAILFILAGYGAGAQDFLQLTSGTRTSIRGLSVVNDSIAWVSGSNGWIARTADKGKTWDWKQLEEQYKSLDFRDIEAFSASSAIVVNAGSPAVILKTQDGGVTWKEVYRNTSPDIFLDGMDFWDERRGLIFGDPIKNRMQLLSTDDSGNSWQDISANQQILLAEGEASFAASGTTIRMLKGGSAWIATGGNRSRIFYTGNFGKSWIAYNCPIVQGKATTGPFSIAFRNNKYGIVVGGDYQKDTLRTANAMITRDGGKTWTSPVSAPMGYRSAVEFITGKLVIATGTSGTDISYDSGVTWALLSKEAFNVVRRAKAGTRTLLAGSNGKIYSINIKP